MNGGEMKSKSNIDDYVKSRNFVNSVSRLQQYRRSVVQTEQDNSNLIEEKFGQKVVRLVNFS